MIHKAVNEGITVQSIMPESNTEILGVNDRAQLSELERYYQLVQAHHLMRRGVTIMDPARFDLRGDLLVGTDVCIDINVVLEGSISIGNNVSIGPNCCIKDADIGDDVTILANSVIENSVVGNACKIGPFSRLRPLTRLADNCHIGNFVEIKKSDIDEGSKINHLSYVGDTIVGKNVNIGAGTITCNYDGANKHQTVLGDDVFVGSNTEIVAPVRVDDGATIAAGTTVTKDVQKDALVLSRVDQKIVTGWKRPKIK